MEEDGVGQIDFGSGTSIYEGEVVVLEEKEKKEDSVDASKDKKGPEEELPKENQLLQESNPKAKDYEITKAAESIRKITNNLGIEYTLDISALSKVLDELEDCDDPSRAAWLLQQAILMVEELYFAKYSQPLELNLGSQNVIYQADDGETFEKEEDKVAISHLVGYYEARYPISKRYEVNPFSEN